MVLKIKKRAKIIENVVFPTIKSNSEIHINKKNCHWAQIVMDKNGNGIVEMLKIIKS